MVRIVVAMLIVYVCACDK